MLLLLSHIGDVQFIDYEYSGYNYLAYDIGNHFNEFAGKNWIYEVKWTQKKKLLVVILVLCSVFHSISRYMHVAINLMV